MFRIDDDLGFFQEGQVMFAFGFERPEDTHFLDSLSNYTPEEFSFFVDRKPVWIRVLLNNPNSSDVGATIRLLQPNTKENVVLLHNGKMRYGIHKTGDHGYYYNLVNVPAGNSVLYIRYESVFTRLYPYFEVVETSELVYDESLKFIQYYPNIISLTAFLVLILFQALYVLIQYRITGSLDYINYFFFLLCLSVYFFCRLDYWYGTGVLMEGMPFVAPFLNDLFLVAPFVFYLRFSRYFIDTANRYPKIDVIIKRAEYVIVGIMFLSLFFVLIYRSVWSIWMVRGFTVLFLIFSIYLIRFFYLQRDKQVNFILLGSLFALTGNAFAMLLPVFGLQFNFDNSLFTMVGIVGEIVTFNTGLSYKAKNEQLEKIIAQNKVIQELDRSSKYLHEIESMRGQIADDLHDDVGSTLSSISVYAELGMQGDEKTRLSLLGKISDVSQRMMSAMNDIVWAIHSKNDSLGGLADKMRQFASERLAGEKLSIHLENEKLLDNLHLTMQARRNILLMFKEAVNNALKHGKANNITCTVKSINKGLSIVIVDDGIGFSAGQANLGNGMASMRKRAAELGGSLEVDSSRGKGTKIIFIISINNLTVET